MRSLAEFFPSPSLALLSVLNVIYQKVPRKARAAVARPAIALGRAGRTRASQHTAGPRRGRADTHWPFLPLSYKHNKVISDPFVATHRSVGIVFPGPCPRAVTERVGEGKGGRRGGSGPGSGSGGFLRETVASIPRWPSQQRGAVGAGLGRRTRDSLVSGSSPAGACDEFLCSSLLGLSSNSRRK